MVNFVVVGLIIEKNESFEEIKDWLYGIDLCMNERHFLGLTYNEAPPNIDFCHDLDETFKCIYSNHRAVLKFIPKLKAQFDHFANLYNRLQRTCEGKRQLIMLFVAVVKDSIRKYFRDDQVRSRFIEIRVITKIALCI